VVAIRDSGPGIPTDQIDHLFTPFFTTKSEGTGLGLSICQSIICSYGGTIAVNNLPDRGAEFIIMLPPKLKL
jgi:signal transduction histidine kinase